MVITLEKVKTAIRANDDKIHSLGVKSLLVFGSVVRGEATEKSDLDILVDFSEPVGLFGLLEVKYFLEEILNCKVDLGTIGSLRPEFKENVFKEAIQVLGINPT